MAFRRGKKSSREIVTFEADLERNLLQLCADLNTSRYQHGGYSHRIVNEKKRRDIAVASVRDRVVHRLLYDYLVPLVDPRLDYDVWSCRQGKGLHRALRRTQSLLQSYDHGWVWRADITKFFDNVDHAVLRDCLRRFVSDTKALELLDKVIGGYCHNGQTNRHGIPIGNLTSQIFANIYLNEFDRYVRQSIRPLAYVRYGDDFAVFVAHETQARDVWKTASSWLGETLKLTVHSKNNIVVKSVAGLRYLGHCIYPNSCIVVERSMVQKLRRDITTSNTSSYRSMGVPHRMKRQVPWWLLVKS